MQEKIFVFYLCTQLGMYISSIWGLKNGKSAESIIFGILASQFVSISLTLGIIALHI